MATVYYPDGTLVRDTEGNAYVFVEGQLQEVDGPLIVDPANPDASSSYLASLPFVDTSMKTAAFLPDFPFKLKDTIEATQEDEIASTMPRRYMRTTAWAQKAGNLSCVTVTWTRQPWIGFTGGAMVTLATGQQDGPGEYLWSSDLQQFGVDGFRIPFKQSLRVDQWSQSVPLEVAQRVTQIRIIHTHAPRNRVRQQLEETLTTTKDIIVIIAALASLA